MQHKMTARKETLARLQQLLVRRSEALRKAVQGDLSLLRDFNKQTAGDFADFALDQAQYEISSQLIDVQSRELAQTEEALDRIRKGKYGQCDACNGPIAMPRLIALPYTTMCIECARAEESSGPSRIPSHHWDHASSDDDADEAATFGDGESFA